MFQQSDGSYLTFTRLLTTTKGRSVCLSDAGETATACVDWETGKLTLGDRADAATPWRFRTKESLEAFEAEQPGLVDHLLAGLNLLMGAIGQSDLQDGHWVFLKNK